MGRNAGCVTLFFALFIATLTAFFLVLGFGIPKWIRYNEESLFIESRCRMKSLTYDGLMSCSYEVEDDDENTITYSKNFQCFKATVTLNGKVTRPLFFNTRDADMTHDRCVVFECEDSYLIPGLIEDINTTRHFTCFDASTAAYLEVADMATGYIVGVVICFVAAVISLILLVKLWSW